ncbi:MAG: 16S rRNA (guanine(966)-N(2))-methyltransferase RsmD [Lachnospiraceae bacterium]|nr:16S rRNA (guanine(966)-N(2))-methyltransferase RsmD [Lachnospiraceae bacterium]
MRVIAGTARSIPLIAPAGIDTRPTTDKIKETLFNMINFDLPDSVFVDLYSGSGAIGIEAISRGAKHAYFVDNSRKCADVIKANLSKCRFTDQATMITRDAKDSLFMINDNPDIIFMDPPYEQNCEYEIMEVLLRSGLCGKDTLIIIESKIDRDFSDITNLGYTIIKEKKYKNNKHTFFNIS